MNEKIKVSELLKQMVTDSQKALSSEDTRIQEHIFTITGNKNIKRDNATLEDVLSIISKNNEYLRFSLIKSVILSLENLDLIENDLNINDRDKIDTIIHNALK